MGNCWWWTLGFKTNYLGYGGAAAGWSASNGGGGGYYGGAGGIDGGGGGSSYCSSTVLSQSLNAGNGHLSFSVTAKPLLVSIYFNGIGNSLFGRKSRLLPAIKASVITVLGLSRSQMSHTRIVSESGQVSSGTRLSMLVCAYDADYGANDAIDVIGYKILDSISLGTLQSNITQRGGDLSALTSISFSRVQSATSVNSPWTC